MTHAAQSIAVCLLGISSVTGALAQGEKIVIDGSTGMTPLVQALAKAYTDQNPAAVIEIGKGLGTKARIQALSEGRIDIAMASHGWTSQESNAQAWWFRRSGRSPLSLV